MDIDAALAAAIDDHRNGRFDAAEAGYSAVLDAAPENVHALSVSAILLFQRGKPDDAIARLERAVALAPGVAGFHNNLANMFRETDRPTEALEHYMAAVQLEPEHVEAICNIGLMYRRLSHVPDAIAAFEKALAIDPGHVESNHNLAMTYAAMGEVEKAADYVERCYAYGRVPVVDPLWHVRILVQYGRPARALEIAELHQKARPDDPIVGHHIAALKRERVERASDDYVRTHFNKFASSFDHTLKDLDYRAPKLVAEQVEVICGKTSVPVAVDLGCGTGLVGPLIRNRCDMLIGVDLSGGMLHRAAAREIDGRKVYDQLVEGELVAFLDSLEPGLVDLALSADTLIYFGALETVLASARRVLRTGGAFIFTLEHLDENDPAGFRLLDSGRFSHTEGYAVAAAAAAGFAVRGTHLVGLRKEFGKYVGGMLLVLEATPRAA